MKDQDKNISLLSRARGCEGYTLPEALISSVILLLIASASLAAYITAFRMSVAGSYQVSFTAQAREASQKISRYIEEGKTIGVNTSGLTIVTVNLKAARIYFEDQDGDSQSVRDNRLMYDPDVSVSGDEKLICNYVSEIPGESMFSIVPATPDAASIRFHVGDGTNVTHASFSGTGQGYQGVEVRVSATPRNLQRWYE